MKGSAGSGASAKSKLTEKSKEVSKEKSQSGKKSQKGLKFIKMVRSSLPEPVEEEQSSEKANSLSANAESNSASMYGITGAVIVAMTLVVGGAVMSA